MSLDIRLDGEAVLLGVQPSSISCGTIANMGEPGYGSLTVEDTDADLSTVGLRPVLIHETACSQPVLFRGWIGERNYRRDRENAQIVGVSRIQDVTLVGLGACFGYRMIKGTDGSRPEETWSERLTWLLGSNYLAGTSGALVEDTGYCMTSTLTMDAVDYQGAYPSAVLDDLCDRYGGAVNYFAFWDTAAETVGLFIGPEGDTIGDCPLLISNVLSDIDGTTTFAPNGEAVLKREPDQVFSEVVVEYGDGKKVFRTMPSTATTHIRRGTTISRPYIGKQATAESAGDQFLAKHSIETDQIDVTIIVPPESAGLIYAGQRVQVKFSHLPNYESFTWMRIRTCTVRPHDETVTQYEVALELVSVAVDCPSWTFEAYALGDGTHVEHYSNSYNNVACSSCGLTHSATGTMTMTGNHWYRTVATVTGTCFPDGDHCYLHMSGEDFSTFIKIGREDPGQFAVNNPNCQLKDVYWSGDDAYGTTITVDSWLDGDSLPDDWSGTGWIGFHANVASGVNAHVTATVYDLGLGNSMGPFNPCVPASGGGEAEGSVIPTPTHPTTTSSTSDPTVNDDESAGYAVGDVWVNTTSGEVFVLTDATTGAAVWTSTTTGGVTDHGALTGLLDDDHTQYVLKRYGGKEVVSTVAGAGATETLNLADGNLFDVTLDADCTFTFAGATNGTACSFTLLLRQNGTGGWDVTWPGSVIWASGTAPTLDTTASTAAVLTFFSIDGGTNWYGFATGGGSVVAALDDLTDVTITTPTEDQFLSYNGSAWVNVTPYYAGELLVADGTTGPNGIVPTSYVEMTTPRTTTSASLVDITGASTTITLQRTSHIVVILNCEVSASGAAADLGLAVSIDGTDHDVVTTHLAAGASDSGVSSVIHRTATELAPGTYTIKGRMKRASGAGTPAVDRADLLVMSMGTSGPVLLTNEAEDDYLYSVS